jgi:hypothetical protein
MPQFGRRESKRIDQRAMHLERAACRGIHTSPAQVRRLGSTGSSPELLAAKRALQRVPDIPEG